MSTPAAPRRGQLRMQNLQQGMSCHCLLSPVPAANSRYFLFFALPFSNSCDNPFLAKCGHYNYDKGAYHCGEKGNVYDRMDVKWLEGVFDFWCLPPGLRDFEFQCFDYPDNVFATKAENEERAMQAHDKAARLHDAYENMRYVLRNRGS